MQAGCLKVGTPAMSVVLGWVLLQRNCGFASKVENPTHASGWIVKLQPTTVGLRAHESHPREWVDC